MKWIRDIPRLPLVAVALVLLAVPLLALLELPGERKIKEALGFEYEVVQRCGEIRERGRWGNGWRREPSFPNGPRDEARAVTVGTSAYLAGGIVSLDLSVDPGVAESVDTFERFDFETGRYARLPPLPRRLNHVGLAAHEGYIYAMGGFTDRLGAHETTAQAWRYGIAQRRWERIAPMPTRRGSLGVAVVDDTLYAIGGRDKDLDLKTVEAYDLRTGRWSKRADMRTGRDHLGVATQGGLIYAVAGRSISDYSLGSFERYDPERDRWTPLPDHPEPVSSVGLESVNGRLVIPGGSDSFALWLSGATWSFDPRTEAWSRLASMPEPKHGYASAVYDGRLYAFGGSRCSAFRASGTVSSLKVPPA